MTEQSKRLGQWMDWGNDYYTFSDTNIEYIWRFLKVVHERGWLYVGHRSTEWCPRCGTSISAHELTGRYVDRADPSPQRSSVRAWSGTARPAPSPSPCVSGAATVTSRARSRPTMLGSARMRSQSDAGGLSTRSSSPIRFMDETVWLPGSGGTKEV